MGRGGMKVMGPCGVRLARNFFKNKLDIITWSA